MAIKIRLIKPNASHKNAVLAYKETFINRNESIAGGGTLEKADSFEVWLDNIEAFDSTNPPRGKVPSKQFIAINENNELCGLIDLRLHINHPVLSTWGGHIGYSVLPKYRNQGIATAMLKEMIKIAKEYKIYDLLITCDIKNIASEKVIKANGGIFEKIISVDNHTVKRYWIHL